MTPPITPKTNTASYQPQRPMPNTTFLRPKLKTQGLQRFFPNNSTEVPKAKLGSIPLLGKRDEGSNNLDPNIPKFISFQKEGTVSKTTSPSQTLNPNAYDFSPSQKNKSTLNPNAYDFSPSQKDKSTLNPDALAFTPSDKK